jgi:guanylate cyclase
MNDVFSRLDHLVERHGAEKIRTIGDGYMVAAGVPKRQPDHAAVLCELALDMIEELRHVPARNGRRVEVRIGINSGPLVAGVIGRRRYQYDLWGETVTLASRMESHGEPGRVHISEATYAHVRDRFVCESRGRIPVKGIGEIDTWYIARAPATDSDAGAIA